ncbi:hypothetical protein [Curtobacterium sp. 'Ferrero']|uniref:hypothetical protein n=1 Tax=Curtobacterium sp. 'Ferrero' TaxID=2033654 RepID=UPI0011440609|nr:hypothetical protein [Curtobacterium sp. 'Ferrero']
MGSESPEPRASWRSPLLIAAGGCLLISGVTALDVPAVPQAVPASFGVLGMTLVFVWIARQPWRDE